MIGVIGAMEDEVKLLRSRMKYTQTKTIGPFEFISGELEGKETALLRCGIGKVNAALGTAFLIQSYHPDLVINSGSAGGIDPSLKFGDAVISTGLLYHDVDLTGFKYKPGQLPGCPAEFPVKEDLILRAERAVAELKAENILPEDFAAVRGVIASGDTFMYESSRLEALRKSFPQVKAVEMEGAAVAHTCFLFAVPALIIRALSDIAGTESPLAFDEFLPLASMHSGQIVCRIINEWSTPWKR
ncbi:MAG: 5'-methylthioadenosine/S-adenosylhomocysteine nucleosidase [Spirochaetaceae bacterium]|jgi:adenosylhomocysteine nucleosidase|nr:5'-methylthioadenosine/S-adenosylhomocysteine nucleosidase [Spirochaetaceae bacterium]